MVKSQNYFQVSIAHSMENHGKGTKILPQN